MTNYFTFLPLLIVVLLMSQTSVLATKIVADDEAESESPIDIMGTVADHDYFTFLVPNYICLDYFYGKMRMENSILHLQIY